MALCAAAPIPQRANALKASPPFHIVPISKLPPEILEEIFKLCVLGMYEPRPYYTPSSSSHALQDHATSREENHYLPWMQVCSAWRIISLSSPRLWCTVDLSRSSHFAEECLRRSKNALITLISSTSEYGPLRLFSNEQDYHNCPLSPSSHLSSLRLNASRIKLIDLFLFPTDMYTLFNTILSSSLFFPT
ncbi:hypothetical protein CPB84DRAFT_584226 [Gymnopilus junonius]|uniref:F-box domain-containing protein n=1 Tax=Gymnopilus junonius TaxID=109634 RepID=A0A9P5N9P7_GYMJU|nr:hypothetical protein CPB84DRAFT_584226 [Gymnopilus junonius]